jgi:hypothetical protein
MNWYYAAGGQQQGPVDDAQLDALLSSGQINAETLIWRDGMANWQPLRQARSTPATLGAPPVQPGGETPPVASGTSAAGEIVCAECGKTFTKDNAIQYGSTWVCASCKPVFLQKLREGTSPGAAPSGMPGAPFDADAFLAGIRERDYSIDIGSCLSRGWELVKSNFWISVGVVVLIYLCGAAAGIVGIIPCLGYLIQGALQGPLMGGLCWFFLKLIRRQEATVGDAFTGFSRGFLQLCLVGLISTIFSLLCMVPGIITVFAVGPMKVNVPVAITVLAFAVGFIPMIYLSVCWMFSMPLVIDKGLDFWPAMELSRKVVSLHWGTFFVLLIACFLVAIAGFLALCVGVLVAAPVIVAALMYAYEDIFSGRAPEPT